MPSYSTGVELRGRQQEKETLTRLLADVRAGHSRVLALSGEAGTGKTALLDHVAELAHGFRIVRAAGVEQESEIAYSALQSLCAPLLGHLDGLPEVQRAGLSTAFGLSSGSVPDPLLLGMAVLGLLTEAAADQPLLCLIDDVQWADRMSAVILTFVARRLDADSVALIFASRPAGDDHLLAAMPEMRVTGLPDADARALLDSVLAGPVDARVRDRIVAETRGNPLALMELPRGLSPAELAFGFGTHRSSSIAGRVEDGFQRRVAALPADTRMLALTAAVEPTGDVPLLWRALDRLGIGPEAAAPAEREGLIEFGARVRFRHPLVRSAIWRSADAPLLRQVHAALGEVIDPQREPDRRAWHRAHACLGPDEDVAGELERSAGRALARGGRAAAASFLERAAALTPDPARRAGRTLAAARARLDAGSPTLVPDLLAAAELGPLDQLQRAGIERLRAQVTFMLNPGREAGPPLLAAAHRLGGLDPAAARETYLAALGAAMWTGRLGEPGEMRQYAEAAMSVPPGDDVPGLFLRGLIAWSGDRPTSAFPLLSRALAAMTSDEDLRLLWLAAMVCMELRDLESWLSLTERAVRFARGTGTLSVLPAGLSYQAGAFTFAGRLPEAWDLLDEAEAAGQATGLASYLATGAVMAAHQGRERTASETIAKLERDAEARGVGRLYGLVGYTRAVLHNGLGNHHAALDSARLGVDFPDLSSNGWGLSELIEAATRTGEAATAADARERLREQTSAAGTPWALGAQALADALAGADGQAEDHYKEAIDQFTRGQVGMWVARARLLYGEWLRRENRRSDARAELHPAYDAFLAMGTEAFADRAGRELLATGETVRRRTSRGRDELTPQEAKIARLAIAGQTNPEIGATLFLSPRTVEWHLRKVFGKLGISSRRELPPDLGER